MYVCPSFPHTSCFVSGHWQSHIPSWSNDAPLQIEIFLLRKRHVPFHWYLSIAIMEIYINIVPIDLLCINGVWGRFVFVLGRIETISRGFQCYIMRKLVFEYLYIDGNPCLKIKSKSRVKEADPHKLKIKHRNFTNIHF